MSRRKFTDEERKERQKASAKRSYQKNRKKILLKQKKYAEDNKEKISERQRKHYIENKEKISQRHKEYRDKNKDKTREYYERNKDVILAQKKEYYEKNKEELSKKHKKYQYSPAKYDAWFEKISPYYEPDQIRRDPENPELIQIKCHLSSCKNWVNPTYDQLSHRYKCILGESNQSHGECHIYCSDECKNSCPTYGQHVWPKGFKVNGREVQPELRKLVLERDNYTCQREGCGKSLAEFPDLVLHCHHKFPLNEDPVCSADIDNCITLCEECHKWVHQNVPGCGYAELRCSQ